MSAEALALSYSSPLAKTLHECFQASSAFAWEHKRLLLSGLEAGFYQQAQSTIRDTTSYAFALRSSVNQLALNHFQHFQVFFISTQALLSLHSFHQILNALNHPVVNLASQTRLGKALPTSLCALAIFGTSTWFCKRHMCRNEQEPREHIETTYSRLQIANASMQLTGVVCSLAMAALSQNKTAACFTAACQTYSFLRNNDFIWCVFSHSMSQNIPQNSITGVNVQYNALIRKINTQEICTICRDGEDGPKYAFCSKQHPLHQKCLEESLQRLDYLRLITSNPYDLHETRHYQNGVHIRNSYHYELTVNEDNLPSCPTCRERPFHHKLTMTVKNRQHGLLRVNVNRSDDREFPHFDKPSLDKIDAVYSALHAALSGLQQIPEFAPRVTKIQNWLMLVDVISAIAHQIFIAVRIYENSREAANRSDLTERILTAALPLLATYPLYHFLDKLSLKAKPSLEGLAGVHWRGDFNIKAQRVVSIYRLLTSLGSAALSENKSLVNAASIAGQCFSLFTSYSLPWLTVQQKGLDLGLLHFQDLEVCTTVLPPAKTLQSSESLQAMIKKVRSLQTQVLNQGTFYSLDHYINGIYTHSTLWLQSYYTTVKDLREHFHYPYLHSWTAHFLKNTFKNTYFHKYFTPTLVDLSALENCSFTTRA